MPCDFSTKGNKNRKKLDGDGFVASLTCIDEQCRYDVPIYVTATRNISTYNVVWFVPPIFLRLTFFSFRKLIRFIRARTYVRRDRD